MAQMTATGALRTVRSKGYTLEMKNGPKTAISINLSVFGEDGREYTFQVKQRNTKTGFIMKVLGTISRFWPASDFDIQVDDNSLIVDISS